MYIRGRVQGVSFRYYTMTEAKRLGVTGWVCNLWDGRVEAVAEGEEEHVQQLVEWCHRGPHSAVVDQVDWVWETPTSEFQIFSVRLEPIGE
jgi:acylphosphatase